MDEQATCATVALTTAQCSALGCAGLDLDPRDLVLAGAWDGLNALTVTAATQDDLVSALIDRCNAEDAQADVQKDRYARRAATALGNLAFKVRRLRFATEETSR